MVGFAPPILLMAFLFVTQALAAPSVGSALLSRSAELYCAAPGCFSLRRILLSRQIAEPRPKSPDGSDESMTRRGSFFNKRSSLYSAGGFTNTHAVILGGIAGALLALSGIAFWSNLPNHDLRLLLDSLSKPELTSQLDGRLVFAYVLVFALSLNAIFGVLDRLLGVVALAIAGALGGITLAAIFGIDTTLVSSITVGAFGGELTIGGDVRVVVVGVLVFLIPALLVQGIVRYFHPDQEHSATVLRSSLIAALGAAGVVFFLDSTTPPTRMEQISQMQTAVAATATENSVQIAIRATLAPTETAAAKQEAYELTVIAQLAATLNQPSPTHPSEATDVPTTTPIPNVLETQLAQALAEIPPPASPQSSTMRNAQASNGSTDADLWLQRLEALATILGGGGVLGFLTLLLRRRSSKQDTGY